MQRTWAAALAAASVAAVTTVGFTTTSPVAGASAVSVKVSPNTGLAGGQTVTVTGRISSARTTGLPRRGSSPQCTASVRGHLRPSTDTSHCDVTSAKALRVSRNGTFSRALSDQDRHHRRRVLRDPRPPDLCDRCRHGPGSRHRGTHHLPEPAGHHHLLHQHEPLTPGTPCESRPATRRTVTCRATTPGG